MNIFSTATLGVALVLAGCTTPRQMESPSPQLELISMTPLPMLTPSAALYSLKCNVMFRILSDGSVAEAQMLRSSGDPEWDRAAVDSLKHWRFSPFTQDPTATDRWIRYSIAIQIQEPVVMNIGMLSAATQGEADSLYLQLTNGASFDSLARCGTKSTAAGTEWYFPSYNIGRFPQHVREAVAKLRINGITHPIKVGSSYVIYRRFRCSD